MYENIVITPLKDSEVSITGSITASTIEKMRPGIIKKLSGRLSIDGFRAGHIPESVAIEHLGDMRILEETAHAALEKAYPEIVIKNSLEVIGKPKVTITKLALGIPVDFNITSAVMPEITLPDYASIAKKLRDSWKNISTTVSDTEFADILLDIRKRHALVKKKELDPTSTALLEEIKEEDLAPLTDDMVGQFGEFASVEELTKRLRADVQRDKEHKEKERQRAELADALVAETAVTLPTIFVESELDKMFADMEARIERMNASFDDYLTHTQKTREALREEWRPEAKKRATLQLLLSRIAQKEVIVPSEVRVSREVAHLLEHYPEANADALRTYVETLMANDMVFLFLETGEKKSSSDEALPNEHEGHDHAPGHEGHAH